MTPVKDSGEVTPRSHLYMFLPLSGCKICLFHCDAWWSIKACGYSSTSALKLTIDLPHITYAIMSLIVKISKFLLGLVVIAGVVASAAPFARAADYGGGSVQGYAAGTPIDIGTIVLLTGKNSN